MNHDARGVPVTGANDEALRHYEQGVRAFHSYVGDPIAAADAALAAAPGLVAGHLLKTLALVTLGERQFATLARASLDAAKAQVGHANERERELIAASEKLCSGDWRAAGVAIDRVLAKHPRDLVALQAGHLMDFYQGDAFNLRTRVSRVLPHWSADLPGYSFLLGMHAFGLEEMNQYGEAEETARRALAIEPRDGWAVHAVAHVMEMEGRIDDGIRWLTSREQDWAPDNGFAFHNFWHLGLFHLDRFDVAGALKLYDAHVRPDAPAFVLSLIDATAMLWRIWLEGGDVGARWNAVADDWQQRLEAGEPGYYAFNDLHATLAFVATGRQAALDHVMASLRRAAEGTDSNAAMSREVGLPLAQAMADFGRGRYAAAADGIEDVRGIAHRFGGSHAQRDLLTLTLIEAARRAGDRARAAHYIAERLVHKPRSAWGPRLMQRLATREEAIAA